MSSATLHNAPNTAQTSHRKPPSEVELSEADYLAREVEDSKEALSHAMADLKNGLKTTADLRLWVKHYPCAALGAATVAGFAAAAAVTPAKGETIGEKFAHLKEAAKSSMSTSDSSPAQAAPAQSPKANFLNSLFDVAKVLLQTIIMTTFQQHSQDPAENVAATDRRPTTSALS